MTAALVPASKPKEAGKVYGAACLPTVRRFLWETDIKAEHTALIAAYEEHEGNCNTCVHLQRLKHEKDPQGFLLGRCARNGLPLKFHPQDPLDMPCWKSRRVDQQTKTT